MGGAFSINLGDNPALRLLAAYSNLRSRLMGEYLGDHGIFVRRSVFEELGGFAELELMEDVEFSERLKKTGKTIKLQQTCEVSARRFDEAGVIKTTVLMSLLHLLHWAGISPRLLSRLYYAPPFYEGTKQ